MLILIWNHHLVASYDHESKYSIQHFSKLVADRRVKLKMTQVFKYVIIDDEKLEVAEHCYWEIVPQ